ncbi:hypothetical protein TNCV_3816191 [Trichonephila clavipes]|nr:hypothetical protein TNCV_3816191 [Trichonephila clavipes]
MYEEWDYKKTFTSSRGSTKTPSSSRGSTKAPSSSRGYTKTPSSSRETKNLQQLNQWTECVQETFMVKNDPKLSLNFKCSHVFLHRSHLNLILLPVYLIHMFCPQHCHHPRDH